MNKLKGLLRAINIMSHKIFILQEKIFLFFVLSFILFWLRAVNYDINLINFGKLLVSLSINIPIFFLVSSDMRSFFKKIFGGQHKYLKLSIYTIISSFVYSILIAKNVYYSYSYFKNIMICTAFFAWQPFIILVIGYFLIDRFNESELSIKVIIFITFVLVLSDISLVATKYFIPDNYLMYKIVLLKVVFYNGHLSFNLYTALGIYLSVMVIMLSDIPNSQIGFTKKWNKKTKIFITVILGTMMTERYFMFVTQTHQFIIEKLVWNLITAFAGVIVLALLEELFFRGIIQNYLATILYSIKDHNIIAIVITALLFGVWHYPFINTSFSFAFIMGLFLGWVYYVTQNLWAPVLIHGLNNLMTTAIVY